MCGIAIALTNKPLSESRLHATLKRMESRGPDGAASKTWQSDKSVTFFHSRLSILDLHTRSDQPFTIGPYTLVYNGEIYNFREIRSLLEKEEVSFSTTSDTEVLLQAYIRYGTQCLEMFEGMWAFAIYNDSTGEVILSRDRFGEKPLYYTRSGEALYFASEIGILESLTDQRFSLNMDQVYRYLIYGFRRLKGNNQTFYEGIFEVPKGTYTTLTADLECHFQRYWEVPQPASTTTSFEESVEEFKDLFRKSIEIRLRSDVPLAFCLSGGLDSSAIVATAVQEYGVQAHTFSIIDGDERYNEEENINQIVNTLGCKNTSVYLQKENFFERLEELLAYHREPLATISYYVHSYLSAAIGEEGYKVALSGTGADELLGGYYDHTLLQLAALSGSDHHEQHLADWSKYIAPSVRNPELQNPDRYLQDPSSRDHLYLNHEHFRSFLQKDFIEEHKEKTYHSSLFRNRMMNELFDEIVPVILHEDDLNSMMHSIENRSPFLDTSLLNFALAQPDHYLIRSGYTKAILRESLKGVIPDTVRLDREKRGFNASLLSLIDLQSKETIDYLAASERFCEMINMEKVGELLTRKEFPNSYNKFLFNLLNVRVLCS